MAKEDFKRDLGAPKKKVVVSSFKGQVLVNVREWYQKDGEWKPTSKGIALTKDQWKALCEMRGEIDAEIAELEGESKDEPPRKKAKVKKSETEEEES